MTGVKGRSGRKKAPNTVVQEAIDGVRDDLPAIFEALAEKAKGGSETAAIYLINRILGMPKQQIDTKIGPDESWYQLQERALQLKLYELKAWETKELNITDSTTFILDIRVSSVEGEGREPDSTGSEPGDGVISPGGMPINWGMPSDATSLDADGHGNV